MRTVKAGLIYFLLVFVLGWILGPIREFWGVMRLGRVAALLTEGAIMLIAMWFLAQWVIRRFGVRPALPARIAMGLVALGVLGPAEIAGALWLRGISLGNYLAGFANVTGVISLVMFLLFAAMPIFVTLFTRGRFR
jgi:hypothetical protein